MLDVKPISEAPKDGTQILLYGEHECDCGMMQDANGENLLFWVQGTYYSEMKEWYTTFGYPSNPSHFAFI